MKNKKEKVVYKKANSVELGYRPPHSRILWVGVIVDNNNNRVIKNGATHEGLVKALDKNKFDEFMVIDLKMKQVVNIPTEKVNSFLDVWKENYFNTKWGYKKIKSI